MPPDFDVIVIGSGPAGVSAAFPLVEAGLKVLMVDGGKQAEVAPQSLSFLTERSQNPDQWKWMIGEDHVALRNLTAVSPKFRVPALSYAFEDFATANPIQANNFVAVGSLARGGLSNAWGCGVARLSATELAPFPVAASDMEQSYARVTRRIGVSGAQADDLTEYFGLDAWAQPPIPMDAHHRQIFTRYTSRKQRLAALGFRLGRSRVAALSSDHNRRNACNLSGNCLWGCHRKALYSAADELPDLLAHDTFRYRSGLIVDRVDRSGGRLSIRGRERGSGMSLSATRIVIAAGTLATTRLALLALETERTVQLLSNPSAAFLLWSPSRLGSPRTDGFGLGQLSFSLDLDDQVSAFGSTFSTGGIPVAEFARHLPFGRRHAIDLLRSLLSSCLVGNLFLPGRLSDNAVALDRDGVLKITGGHAAAVGGLLTQAESRLRKAFWQMRVGLLPKSFTAVAPGGDIHYACTLPMRQRPVLGETDANGELAQFGGVHIVDGACLPTLTEKSHTLTIMANADRIGRSMAMQFENT